MDLFPKRIAAVLRGDRRAVAAVEFAIVALPFFLLLFFIFEIGMDLFQQEALEAGLHLAVRQVQTGNAQNVTNGAAFITNYLCPQVSGLLTCSNLSVNIQKVPASTSLSTDYYNYTTGSLPMSGGALNLASFSSASFCNSGPAQFLLVTAIYTSPGIIGNLIPNLLTVSYNGGRVHAAMAQVAAVTENYLQATAAPTAAAAC